MKRYMALLIAILMTLVGCRINSYEKSTEKTIVTMMYPVELKNFEELVESTYEDIDLQVERTTIATMNGDSERRIRNGRGKDIIVTTLPMGDVKNYTSDLSVESFSDKYQATIMKSVLINGETHYLPLPGQYSGYVINTTLSKQCMDKIPESKDEILELFEIAAEKKIGLGDDGTLFGMANTDTWGAGTFIISAQVPDFLGLMDGIKWLSDFQSGKALFSGYWDNSLELLQTITDKGYFNPKAYGIFSTNAIPVDERMTEGKMLLCYGNMNLFNKLRKNSENYEYTMIPFLSNEGNNEWITSSPDGYLAMNKSLDDKGNEEKRDASIRVLELFSTIEGQNAWLEDTSATTSYLLGYANEELELPEKIQKCVDNKCVYNIQIPSDVVLYLGTNMICVLAGTMSMEEALEKIDDYCKNGSEEVDYNQSIIGTVEEDMLCENNNTRLEETEIGNLVADAVSELTGSSIAFVNGGGIRASLYKGDVYGSDLSAVCPYDNKIVVVKAKGSVIKEMLENGISQTVRDGIPAGRFLQVSGLCYSYKPMTENSPAELLSVTLSDGSEIEDDKEYDIAISDYMAGKSGYHENNGDGFKMLNLYSDDYPSATGVTLVKNYNMTYQDALKAYFKNHNDSAISKKLEGRITVVNGG